MNKDFYNYKCEVNYDHLSTTREFPSAQLDMHLTCSPQMARKIETIIRESEPICCTEQYMETSKQIIELVSNKLFSPKVERVIFNDQATILFWDDGEKTVVKCRECDDGHCIFDKDFDLFLSDENTVTLDDMEKLEETISKIARCAYCQTHFDTEKAVMAAMLKRLYPNFQNVLRNALEGGEE